MALPSNNINLNLYRIFYTVAKTKSFSESSRTLHISQPAISKHIQNLEYELDTLLFYRTNRGIELTPEAVNLLAYVEKAYNYLILGERELEESKELTKGKISIGVPTIIGSYYINAYLNNKALIFGIMKKIQNSSEYEGYLEQGEVVHHYYKKETKIRIISSYKENIIKENIIDAKITKINGKE